MINAEFHLEMNQGLQEEIRQAALRGLMAGGEHILDLARATVPLEEGTLERSGRSSSDGEGAVAVSFDTPYAVRQHEDLTARHAGGRKAKYLENALAEGAEDVGRLVQVAVQRAAGA
jgi:hypothetical protein